jgi:hypothetical protein
MIDLSVTPLGSVAAAKLPDQVGNTSNEPFRELDCSKSTEAIPFNCHARIIQSCIIFHVFYRSEAFVQLDRYRSFECQATPESDLIVHLHSSP